MLGALQKLACGASPFAAGQQAKAQFRRCPFCPLLSHSTWPSPASARWLRLSITPLVTEEGKRQAQRESRLQSRDSRRASNHVIPEPCCLHCRRQRGSHPRTWPSSLVVPRVMISLIATSARCPACPRQLDTVARFEGLQPSQEGVSGESCRPFRSPIVDDRDFSADV